MSTQVLVSTRLSHTKLHTKTGCDEVVEVPVHIRVYRQRHSNVIAVFVSTAMSMIG